MGSRHSWRRTTTGRIVALEILFWLYTRNEFLFALILTGVDAHVRMSQFAHETGIDWHLISATAAMAIGPALIVNSSSQEYVVKGWRV